MKKETNIIILLYAIIIIFFSCQPTSKKLSKEEMRKIVESRNTMLGDCFKSGDANKVAAMYCDSAKLCPDGSNFVHGRDSIKAFWAEDFKTSKTLEMKTNISTVDGDENVIYETGKASSKILYKDSVYHVTVKYINVWRKQADGNYLLDIDFWNRNGK